MKIYTLAKWFLSKNPELCGGYVDENTKLNKLLYLTYLMYYAVNETELTNDKFERWDNGPVSREIYTEYRYHGLGNFFIDTVEIKDKNILQFLEIVNLVYSNKTARELSAETHGHSIWIEAKKNEYIDFHKISDKEKCLMKNIYDAYSYIDFDNISMEKIGGNVYYYNKNNIKMSDEIVSMLEQVEFQNDPMFIENIDGELVFS